MAYNFYYNFAAIFLITNIYETRNFKIVEIKEISIERILLRLFYF